MSGIVDAVAGHIDPTIAQWITLSVAQEPAPLRPHQPGAVRAQCRWCDATSPPPRADVFRDHSWHADDCVWRMAREAVEVAKARTAIEMAEDGGL